MLMGKKTIGTCGIMGGVPFAHMEFCWSLAQMLQYSHEYVCGPGEIIHLDKSDISYHMTARNGLAKRCLGDWMLMLDVDHAFSPDLLARMLFAMNVYQVDVLSALYHYRTPPHLPVLFVFDKEKKAMSHLVDWDCNAKIFEIDSAGAGTLLIKKNVFERIYSELNEEPFSITPPYSEDHSFFLRLRQLGIKAYCTPYIESAHLYTNPITSADYTDRMPELNVEVPSQGYKAPGVPI